MWLTGLGASLLVVALLTLGLQAWQLSQIDDLNDSVVPAHGHLVTAERGLTDAQLALENLVRPLLSGVGAADPGALSEVSRNTEQARRAWNSFLSVSLDLPGEAELVAQVDAALPGVGAVSGDADASLETIIEEERVAYSEARNGIVAIDSQLYEPRIGAGIDQLADARRQARQTIMAVAIFSLVALAGLTAGGVRWARRQHEREAALEAVRSEEARRNELEARLQRALEMAEVEDRTYQLIGRALREVAPSLPAELLLADSSRAHFHQALSTDAEGRPGCPVGTPGECPAVRQGQTMIYPSSTHLDACPHLENRIDGACSAICVPVSIAGQTIGVVHAIAPDGQPPSRSTAADIELVSRKASERIGIIRAYAASQTQARTDPLTGLLNRRSLENGVREIVSRGDDYAVVFADLDHFKALNDVHGHDTGDRALRVFAQSLRDGVRPGDVVGRFGGEEFVLVLPGCTVADAVGVIERVQAHLAQGISRGRVPGFTSSFGVATSAAGHDYEDVLAAADHALLGAKAAGRDRIEIADEVMDRVLSPIDESGRLDECESSLPLAR